MHRRQYLATLGTGAAAVTAGCSGSSSDTYLSKPDRKYESSDVPFPAYGQQLPTVTLTDPIADEQIETTGGDGDTVMTFFYSHCQTVCPRLISALRSVQAKAIDEGLIENTRFRAVTFDPERDGDNRLGQYAERMNVSLEDNWRFLRPDSPSAAKDVVRDTFGVAFQRTHPENMDMYMFTHRALILLVNDDNYVERAYTKSTPQWHQIYDDLALLRKREG